MINIVDIEKFGLLKDKNTSAFLELREQLLSFIKSRVPSEEDAEDLIQDVFLTMQATIEPIQQLRAWLFRVSRNKIIDRYRKKTPASFSRVENFDQNNVEDVSKTPEGDMMDEMVWNAIQEGLKELPKAQKDVFEMHEFEGLSFQAISDLTGEQVNTLISRKHYAVKYLRKRLQNIYNDLKD
jgi:RNA polymerase sigma factor (sigma-70 family)